MHGKGGPGTFPALSRVVCPVGSRSAIGPEERPCKGRARAQNLTRCGSIETVRQRGIEPGLSFVCENQPCAPPRASHAYTYKEHFSPAHLQEVQVILLIRPPRGACGSVQKVQWCVCRRCSGAVVCAWPWRGSAGWRRAGWALDCT